jgi:hypothetical protein
MGKRAAGLRKARALISDPSNWTKHSDARDKDDFEVPAHSARLRSFARRGHVSR